MVSDNEQVALVVARIGDDVFSQSFYREILALAEQFEGPENLHVAGRPIVEGTMATLGPRDMKRMVPIVVAVITVVLFLLLRSVSATIITLLVVLLSSIWTFGFMALLRIPVYSVSTMIPVMLIAIGVAYGIHLYTSAALRGPTHSPEERKKTAEDVVRAMWRPIALTAITTMVGFVSLATSRVYPIKYFGLFTAFGVLAALLLSFLLIPPALRVFSAGRGRSSNTRQPEAAHSHLAARIADSVAAHRSWVLGLTAAVLALSGFGISRVWIDSSFLDKFEDDSAIVRTDTFINKHFGGTSTLNVVLESEQEGTFKDPAVLRIVDSLQTQAEKLPKVGNSFALTDYLKRMNKVMHADSAAHETIPPSRDLVAQYLLLYEMSGDPDNLWQLVDYEYRRANVTLQLKSDNSRAIKGALAVVDEFSDYFGQHGVSVNFAGSGYKSLIFTDLILSGQISSLLLSLVLVVILISLMFRSVKLGLIGAIPIAATSVVGFGVMGLLNIPLSTTTALISSIAIGVGVDYAIHFIDKYLRNLKQTGNAQEASRRTMDHTGRAILFNAIVVVAGFMVLLFSVFPPNRMLGLLISLNMLVALIGTVTVMYVLLRMAVKPPVPENTEPAQSVSPRTSERSLA
ncbi:MAG: MMPL family transporter [Chitinivibrionales bacterium]|nr:MMPL family transporter [Chitinivibrionales bacterium]